MLSNKHTQDVYCKQPCAAEASVTNNISQKYWKNLNIDLLLFQNYGCYFCNVLECARAEVRGETVFVFDILTNAPCERLA